MPAAALAVIAGGAALYQGISSNQTAQHAKGAAQAEQTAINAQANTASQQDAANKQQQANSASSTQAASIAALRASLSSSSSNSSILTGPQGAAAAPTQAKTLLGA
jgi:hypothetical protein